MSDRIMDDSTFIGFYDAMKKTGNRFPINAGDARASVLVINADGNLEYKRPEDVNHDAED